MTRIRFIQAAAAVVIGVIGAAAVVWLVWRSGSSELPTPVASAPSVSQAPEAASIDLAVESSRGPPSLGESRPGINNAGGLTEWIKLGFKAENYRAIVQAALIDKKPASVRMAVELETYCTLSKITGAASRIEEIGVEKRLGQELVWRERACTASGGIDGAQRRSLSALQKSMERAPELLRFHLTGTAAEVAELNGIGDAAAIAEWGALAIRRSKKLVVGEETVLSAIPDGLASDAWQAAACRIHRCDELAAMIGNCFDAETCRLSLAQRYERNAMLRGVSQQQWRELEAAMANRVERLFPLKQ
jgi:hypothetical protein